MAIRSLSHFVHHFVHWLADGDIEYSKKLCQNKKFKYCRVFMIHNFTILFFDIHFFSLSKLIFEIIIPNFILDHWSIFQLNRIFFPHCCSEVCFSDNLVIVFVSFGSVSQLSSYEHHIQNHRK